MRCYPCVHRARSIFCRVLGCLVADSWEPGNGITPPFISFDSLTPSFLLHWTLNELPEPICCRGIIFGIVAVAPFSFHHGDKCFISLMLTFNKNCINLIMSSASFNNIIMCELLLL